jgi:hypothetical protein
MTHRRLHTCVSCWSHLSSSFSTALADLKWNGGLCGQWAPFLGGFVLVSDLKHAVARFEVLCRSQFGRVGGQRYTARTQRDVLIGRNCFVLVVTFVPPQMACLPRRRLRRRAGV